MISLQSTELLRVLPKINSNELTRDLSDVASRFNPESNPKPKVLRVNLPVFPPLLPKTRKSGASNINKYPIRILQSRGWNEEKIMAFENMATWGMTWGYIFVIVIAGLALLVGKKKGLILKRKKLEAESKSAEAKPAETSPELEQVDDKKVDDKKQADGKESEKN